MNNDWKYLFLKKDGSISVRGNKYPLPKDTERAIYTPEFIWGQSDKQCKEYFNRVDRVKKCLDRMAGKEG